MSTSSASWVRPKRLESVAAPARSWVVNSLPTRPRAAWLWLVWSARVLLPESMVPVKKCSSATGQNPLMVSPLISAADLHESLADVTVLDVRYRMGGPGGQLEYERGHVPGAAYVDLDADLAAPPGAGGRHPLPEKAAFEAAMRRAGVCDDRPVVVYDDWSGLAAGRAWWLLRFHGHRDVRVLDGVWAAWLAAGGAVHAGTVLPGRGDFTARPGSMPVV